jgi:hypothetical protein
VSATEEPAKLGGRLREIGRSGLRQYAGVVREDPDPEFNGERWRRTVSRMMQDAVLGAGLQATKLLIRNAPRAIQPADQSRKAKAAAELVETAMGDMSHSFGQFIDEVCSMNGYGWAYFEIVYKERRGPRPLRRRKGDGSYFTPPASNYNDGRVGWKKFALRPQDTLLKWEFDPQGGIAGMWQTSPPFYQGTLIPIRQAEVQKALLFRPEVYKNNPEGRSLLKAAWRPWYFGRNIEQIEAMGIERDLNGIPKVEVPSTWLEEEADQNHKDAVKALEELAENVRNDATSFIMIPQLWDKAGNKLIDFSLVSSNGRRTYDTGAILARYDHRKLLALLAQFLLLGSEKVGSFALSATQSDLFAEALNALTDAIADVFNKYAILPLMDLNGIDRKYAPRLKFGKVKKIGLQELGDFIQKLAQAGMRMFPSKSNEDFLYEQAGMPIPEDDDRPPPEDQGMPGGAQGDGAAGDIRSPDGNGGTQPPPAPPAPGKQAPGKQGGAAADADVLPAGLVEYGGV